MSKPSEFAIPSPEEATFDIRLLQKRVEHGFLTNDAVKAYVTQLKPETDYDFTEHSAIEADQASE